MTSSVGPLQDDAVWLGVGSILARYHSVRIGLRLHREFNQSVEGEKIKSNCQFEIYVP